MTIFECPQIVNLTYDSKTEVLRIVVGTPDFNRGVEYKPMLADVSCGLKYFVIFHIPAENAQIIPKNMPCLPW